MSTQTRRIAMPAIYRFTFGGSPEKNKWGWHKASELVEAINTILADRGNDPMTPKMITQQLSFIDPRTPEVICGENIHVSGGELSIVYENEQLMSSYFSDNTDWLTSLVEKNRYLPAKLGMKLIDAVKHPVRAKIAKLLN